MKNPKPSSDVAIKRMKAVKPKDTYPEKILRSELHKRGLRFKIDKKPIEKLNRRADIVFISARVAVFVDGCFWHGCPIHGTKPKANSEFWEMKIKRNKARDEDTTNKLEAAGWKVIRVWEHENLKEFAKTIHDIVKKRT